MHSKEIATAQESITEIRHAIWGNGRDGLLTRIARLEDAMTNAKWLFGMVTASVLSSVGSLVVALLKH